jgi:hypothetical protein
MDAGTVVQLPSTVISQLNESETLFRTGATGFFKIYPKLRDLDGSPNPVYKPEIRLAFQSWRIIMARVKVTFGGHSFFVLDASFRVDTQKDSAGMPVMGSIVTSVGFCVDLHDDKNFEFSKLKAMFDFANVATREKLKEFKVEYLKDDNPENVICSFKGIGWMSSFCASNVGDQNGARNHNHLLHCVIEPVINLENQNKITLGN